MFSIEIAVLFTIAAFSISFRLHSHSARPLSLGWIIFFSLVNSSDEIWTTITAGHRWIIIGPTLSVLSYVAFQLFEFFSIKESIPKTIALENELCHATHESGLKPLVLPARTTHIRFFPKKHSFSYSYLLVGIPVGWRGAIGSFLSLDFPPERLARKHQTRRSWFSINAADYLDRAGEGSSLRGKLESYLNSQCEVIEDYPNVYLVTAPRFLGYSFNPVSFWYLYNGKMELSAMILEVNNTFDERRMYFLKGAAGIEQSEGESPVKLPSRKFKDNWTKDFHVSPFNSRKGSYALSAHDPFSIQPGNAVKIDNTITLNSSKAHAKLVARIFSTQPSIDPTALGYWGKLRFIASWWWVGFVTFPRIVKEAGKLFFRRKLHVWFRPEVLKESIGRRATNEEMVIEQTFRSLLRSLVESSNLNSSLKYLSPIPSSQAEETFTPNSLTPSTPPPEDPIILKITTPLFYARIARYSHISEYLSHEIITDDDKNRTFHISHPQPFLQLFDERSVNNVKDDDMDASQNSPNNEKQNPTYNHLAWRFLHRLRNYSQPPSTIRDPKGLEQQQPITNKIDIRHFGFSRLDHFAMHHESLEQAVRYRYVVIKILLSDIFAFGYPEVFDAAGYVFRVLISYLFVVSVRVFWVWVLGRKERRVRVCHQAEKDWCEYETFYG